MKQLSIMALVVLASIASSAPPTVTLLVGDEGQANHACFHQMNDLDEDGSEWGVYREGSPACVNPENVPTPSLNGNALRCAIAGGSFYSNCHYYRNLPPEPSATQFTHTLSFWFTPTTTCNNQGEPSIIQALEFSTSKWYQSTRYEFALQWENVEETCGDGAPQWRFWCCQNSQCNWRPLGIPQCLAGEKWHTLVLEGKIVDGRVHYHRFTIDQQSYTLDRTCDPVSSTQPDKLAVAIQLDGNFEEFPYDVFVDKVSLVTNVCLLYLPLVIKGE